MSPETIGVLIMAYGTPEQPDEILPYYTDIRRGRAPTPELLAELQSRYAAVGGYGRLTRVTQAQAEGVERLLNQDDSGKYRVYVGMKHWRPYIADTLKAMAADGVTRAVALVMAPQGGRMSIGSYGEALDQANAQLSQPISFERVDSWHRSPGFIAALTERVDAALAKFRESSRETLPVVFTAHSLPERILTWNDPYPGHLREIGETVAARAGLKNVHFAYQSAGRTPDPWLGPDIRETLQQLHADGANSVLVCPAGFVADHLEVLYDLDIELRRLANSLGMHLERTESLNDHPLLLSALAGVVRQKAEGGEAK